MMRHSPTPQFVLAGCLVVWLTNAASAGVLPVADALESFRVAPGFRVELVATEPMVEAPVAVEWDADGRLWVVEMRGYMRGQPPRDEPAARLGRIAVLEDTDGDGRMDRRTLFQGDLRMPRAIAFAAGGVLIADPPMLWFARDRDGDLRCDQMTVLDANFGAGSHVQHGPNGFAQSIDNWLDVAGHDARLRVVRDGAGIRLETQPVPRRGQWGVSRDDIGRAFYNGNASFLHVDSLLAHYMAGSDSHTGRAGIGVSIASDQRVYPVSRSGVTLGDQPMMRRPDGRLARATAACGPTVYRGGQFPASLRGDAFVCEPAGNAVVQFNLVERGGVLDAVHLLYLDEQWGRREFLASTDERFRPVSCATGPDGCLYVVDMHRGVIEHTKYMTSHLRAHINMTGLANGVRAGRIYRVVHEGHAVPATPRLSTMLTGELVERLRHPNGWVRDTAQRLLVERGGTDALPALRSIVMSAGPTLGRSPSDPIAPRRAGGAALASTRADQHDAATIARLHALWTLDGLDGVDEQVVRRALRDGNAHVRAAGVRLAERWWSKQPAQSLDADARLTEQTRIGLDLYECIRDPSEAVRRQLAASLSAIGGPMDSALRQLLIEQGDDPVVVDAAVHGLAGREVEFLSRLMPSVRASDDSRLAPFVKALIGAVERRGIPARVARLNAVLHRPTTRKNPPLSPAASRTFKAGAALYAKSCASCHGPRGLGIEAKAPPLIDSPIVEGSPTRLTRIVLHGLTGPIVVHGRRYDMQMPGLGSLKDEQVAAILTYLRRAWGHRATPVTPRDVAAVRRLSADRRRPWTIEELDAVASVPTP